jgi:hypothetical protein
MRPIHRYHPIEFHQTCAIARLVLLRDPTVDDFEWKEAVKRTCIKQGYDEPQGDMLQRAIGAVEAALTREGHPRPAVQVDVRPLSPARESRPLTHKEAARAITQFNAHGLLKPMPAVPPPVSQRTADRTIAARMVAQEIVASVERCEALERAVCAVPNPIGGRS